MREFSSGSTNYPQIVFFLFVLITYLVDIVLILYGEILSWSLVGVKVLKNRNRDPITIEKILLLNYIKQIYFVLLWVCSVVNHRKCQNRVRTKYGQLAAPCVPLFRCIGELVGHVYTLIICLALIWISGVILITLFVNTRLFTKQDCGKVMSDDRYHRFKLNCTKNSLV